MVWFKFKGGVVASSRLQSWEIRRKVPLTPINQTFEHGPFATVAVNASRSLSTHAYHWEKGVCFTFT